MNVFTNCPANDSWSVIKPFDLCWLEVRCGCQGQTVFSQLLGFLLDREFRRCVARYGGDARPRGFSCWDRYLAMIFAQLTCRAFYVVDRGYVDCERLYRLTANGAFFVVRTSQTSCLQRRYSHPVDNLTGVRSDHIVVLTALKSTMGYPDTLRQVTYLDVETGKRFQFVTNNVFFPALTMARIYKACLQVELFFKDQTASQDQGLLRHQRERGENPNLDCSVCLRSGCHRPEAARPRT